MCLYYIQCIWTFIYMYLHIYAPLCMHQYMLQVDRMEKQLQCLTDSAMSYKSSYSKSASQMAREAMEVGRHLFFFFVILWKAASSSSNGHTCSHFQPHWSTFTRFFSATFFYSFLWQIFLGHYFLDVVFWNTFVGHFFYTFLGHFFLIHLLGHVFTLFEDFLGTFYGTFF